MQGLFLHAAKTVSQLSVDVAPDTHVALGGRMRGVVMDSFQYFVIYGVDAKKVCGVEAMGRVFWLFTRSTKQAKQCLMMCPQ